MDDKIPVETLLNDMESDNTIIRDAAGDYFAWHYMDEKQREHFYKHKEQETKKNLKLLIIFFILLFILTIMGAFYG